MSTIFAFAKPGEVVAVIHAAALWKSVNLDEPLKSLSPGDNLLLLNEDFLHTEDGEVLFRFWRVLTGDGKVGFLVANSQNTSR